MFLLGIMYKIQFDQISGRYIIDGIDNYMPVIRVVSEYSPERFDMVRLNNNRRDYVENNIYQVFASPLNKRIGWIFPGQALFSSQHDYADNPFFLKYAYVICS